MSISNILGLHDNYLTKFHKIGNLLYEFQFCSMIQGLGWLNLSPYSTIIRLFDWIQIYFQHFNFTWWLLHLISSNMGLFLWILVWFHDLGFKLICNKNKIIWLNSNLFPTFQVYLRIIRLNFIKQGIVSMNFNLVPRFRI
jgi:hypothetical protein